MYTLAGAAWIRDHADGAVSLIAEQVSTTTQNQAGRNQVQWHATKQALGSAPQPRSAEPPPINANATDDVAAAASNGTKTAQKI